MAHPTFATIPGQRRLALALSALLVLTGCSLPAQETASQPADQGAATQGADAQPADAGAHSADSQAASQPAGQAGADPNAPALELTSIAGAGASSQAAAMQAWIATYTQANSGATVNYDPIGSGGGREQFLAGGVAFAGSDAPLKEAELAKLPEACGDVIELPVYISPIAIPLHIEGVTSMNLTPDTLAKIFAGSITRWNDPAIAKDNPNTSLPDLAINPVHRGDASGTTENFTDYLAEVAPDAWPHTPSKDWPVQAGESAQQTSGVVSAVRAGNGSIGYADASQVGSLTTATIKVGDEFIAYSAQAAAAIVDGSPIAQGRGPYDIALELDRHAKGGYPIVLVSYQLACTRYAKASTAQSVANWLSYVISPEGQDLAAQSAGSAPISEALRAKATEAIQAISGE